MRLEWTESSTHITATCNNSTCSFLKVLLNKSDLQWHLLGVFGTGREKKGQISDISSTAQGERNFNSVKSQCLKWSFKLGTVLWKNNKINLRWTHNKYQMLHYETKPELWVNILIQCYPALKHPSRKRRMKRMTFLLDALMLREVSQSKIFNFSKLKLHFLSKISKY